MNHQRGLVPRNGNWKTSTDWAVTTGVSPVRRSENSTSRTGTDFDQTHIASTKSYSYVIKPSARKKSVSHDCESLMLAKCGFELAKSLQVSKVMVQASEVNEPALFEVHRADKCIVWLVRTRQDMPEQLHERDVVIELPESTHSRENQLKVGMLLAVLKGIVALDENVVCLSGLADSKRMDTLFVANARRDFPWFEKRTFQEMSQLISTHEFVSTLGVALRLAKEGREGKPIGTSFVLGDEFELSPYLKQLVLNPCQGHPSKNREIHNPEFFETIREFAALDGAFVIDNNGVVQSAGTYLNAPSTNTLAQGLGARHAAARSITELTHAISLVVSSSSGTVTVFHEGQMVLELERNG
ncbi:MAG: DNA integrity scanning protein DisA nucleotide-binding domain protein [Mariniblastus sp.]